MSYRAALNALFPAGPKKEKTMEERTTWEKWSTTQLPDIAKTALLASTFPKCQPPRYLHTSARHLASQPWWLELLLYCGSASTCADPEMRMPGSFLVYFPVPGVQTKILHPSECPRTLQKCTEQEKLKYLLWRVFSKIHGKCVSWKIYKDFKIHLHQNKLRFLISFFLWVFKVPCCWDINLH